MLLIYSQACSSHALLKNYVKSIQMLRFSHQWPANSIRSAFKSYFSEKDHVFIPSSPVVPWSDTSLEFINAGMNQFKSVFLGRRPFPAKRVMNSQKCIRVGGKHNDLSAVGRDTYHHTFFEMLGNWSFNDYFKEDACKMSWELITKVFNIPPEHLYVTYFGGDTNLGLEADEEVKDIWLSIGVPECRVLPFELMDNFWEMGAVGPCGPCTEIHFERRPSARGHLKVNQGSEDLIEIWNLVFIQFQRNVDGELVPLGSQFVDTGMGLERIAACLNGKASNYDTDLFMPLFDVLQKLSGKPNYKGMFTADKDCLDTSYRIVADHSRMFAVALADGLLPHDCYNLRKAIRRVLSIGWNKFGLANAKNFSFDLLTASTDTLGETYPELRTHYKRSKRLLEYEEDQFIEVQMQLSKDWPEILKVYPSLTLLPHASTKLIEGLKYLLPNTAQWKNGLFPTEEAVKLVDKYKISPKVVEDVAIALGFHLDAENLTIALKRDNSVGLIPSNSQNVSPQASSIKQSSFLTQSLRLETNDSYKYHYTFSNGEKYSYPKHRSTVLSVCSGQDTGGRIGNEDNDVLVLDSTNFYSMAGGQISDCGFIQAGDANVFKVNEVTKSGNSILHWGKIISGTFTVGDEVTAEVNESFRSSASRLHTAAHLLRAAVEVVAGMAFQRSFEVTENGFSIKLFVHPPLTVPQLVLAEKVVKEWISQNRKISRQSASIFELTSNDRVTLVSGETYPEDVHLISTTCSLPVELQIGVGVNSGSVLTAESSELCCGTHVFETGHIDSFAISEFNVLKDSVSKLSAVCGPVADQLNSCANAISSEFSSWDSRIISAVENNERLRELSNQFKKWKGGVQKLDLPAPLFHYIEDRANYLNQRMLEKLTQKSNYEELVVEFRHYLNENPNGLILYKMKTDYRGNTENLEVVMRAVSGRAAAFVCKGWGKVRACIYIPEDLDTETATLNGLLAMLLSVIKEGKIIPSKNPEIGHFFVIGVKRDKTSHMLDQILKICTECFLTLK